MKKKNKITIPEQISLRNFLAIVLTLLSVFCLFWPPVLKYSDSYRSDQKKPLIEKYNQSGFSDADAKDYVDALEGDKTYTLFNARKAAHLKAVGYEMIEKYQSGKTGDTDSAIFNDIALNVLFFGLILTGLAACVLYFLKITRIGGIVHLAFSVVLLIGCGIMLLFMRETKNTLSPSVGMFMIPLLALAGCLLYKPEKPVEEPIPDPAANAPKAPETWTCSKCGVANPMDEMFCVSCGTPKESSRRSFCAYCGAPLRAGAPFCTSCGKRQ
jgi:hypothetical protein